MNNLKENFDSVLTNIQTLLKNDVNEAEDTLKLGPKLKFFLKLLPLPLLQYINKFINNRPLNHVKQVLI